MASLGLPATCLAKGAISQPLFPVKGIVQDQVTFWEHVFGRYNSDQFLIHDYDYPLLVIDLVDLRTLPDRSGKAVRDYVERYRVGAKRFGELGEKAISFGAIEQRLYNVYSRYRQHLQRLVKGNVRLRSQEGMADTFRIGMRRAKSYLPFMESHFQQSGLPVDLTRLVFVESMFNPNAKSSAGAVGIWQFMPQTAKQFMRVNRRVDDRYSPYKSTISAAKLLQRNYASLGSWPLAITAYNYGLAGIQQAAEKHKTKQLRHLIRTYNGRRFGFASKNYYAEFLAACRTFERHKSRGRGGENGSM